MIIQHLTEGGIMFMLPIYIMWIVVLLLTVRMIALFNKTGHNRLVRQNEVVVFIGSFAFLFGVLGQVIGFFEAFTVIEQVGDISPALVAGGLRVSMLAPGYGFLLFLISGIIWFIFRMKLKHSAS